MMSRLFGRRYSRGLSLVQRTTLESLLARYRIFLPTQGDGLVDPREFFTEGVVRVWLEVGFGTGEHLLSLARMYTDVGVIGCDVYVNGILSLLRGIEGYGLGNVRIFTDDGGIVLGVLSECSIEVCSILFPDPWPKKRHHKRRFLQGYNLDNLARVMSDDGLLCIGSDDEGLIDWMLGRVCGHGMFVLEECTERRCRGCSMTRYERKALLCGRRPLYLRFRRMRRGG